MNIQHLSALDIFLFIGLIVFIGTRLFKKKEDYASEESED
jgi:hypothetical protein